MCIKFESGNFLEKVVSVHPFKNRFLQKKENMFPYFFSTAVFGLLVLNSLLFGALTQEEYNQIEPYLIPNEHPIKIKLDAIFSQKRAVADEASFKKAGFKWYKRRSEHHVYVAKHSKMKGYLFKLLLDSNIGKDDFDMCLRRVRGASEIRKAIAQHGYKKLFKVPQKWVYILPDTPEPPSQYDKRKVIVVAEKMDILNDYDNESCWKSSSYVNKNLLICLHTLISEVGLLDSVYVDNIPFCEDGKIAFIDTEHFHIWPVPESRLTQRLPKKYRGFWVDLIGN